MKPVVIGKSELEPGDNSNFFSAFANFELPRQIGLEQN